MISRNDLTPKWSAAKIISRKNVKGQKESVLSLENLLSIPEVENGRSDKNYIWNHLCQSLQYNCHVLIAP